MAPDMHISGLGRAVKEARQEVVVLLIAMYVPHNGCQAWGRYIPLEHLIKAIIVMLVTVPCPVLLGRCYRIGISAALELAPTL